MLTEYETRLVRSTVCGGDVATFSFEKPSGYAYAAGQWLRLTLDTAEGSQTKTLTHSSAPADESIEVTTRLSDSAFKRTLNALQVGDAVVFAGPGGRLSIPPDAERIAFLAGGVGITPARSLLRDAVLTGRAFDDALVVYGNRDPGCVPFLAELEAMGGSGVRVVPVYEQPPVGWAGERGFITAETVARHVNPGDGRVFYVSGPPVMVDAMETVLDELGVDAGRRVVERFGPALG